MNKTSSAIVRSLLLGSSALSVFAFGVAHANPTGGVVVSGSATITNSGSGATTTIDQKTGKVVIDWSTFSIGSGSTVQFNQPGSSAIALNRVTGDQPSSIYGNLLANGQVWIINGNGVLFGKGAQINVGGLIATTADLTNDDFLSGDYSFNGATGASVVNQGTIRTRKGGYAVLSGANASNQGLIAADTGTVVIGGAKSYTVDFQGDGLLKYAITAPADKASASNSGTIQAQGGRVVMTARAAQSVQDAVVNNTGMISATSAKVGQDGEVILDGGDGDVAVSGTVDVSGTASGTTGGTVNVTGRNVTVADGTTIDASGDAGGGTVNIGGDLHGQGPLAHATNVTVGKATITADATTSGNGGQVVVWSDNDTSFAGSVSAKGGASGGNGGMVETSGENLNVDPAVKIDTTAPKGKTGTWLIDPTNIFIVDGDQGTLDGNGNAPVGSGPTNDLLAPSTIVAALATTDVSLQASNQIEVVNNIDYTSSHTLSMLAQGNIIVLADIQNGGTGAIDLVAGWDGTTTDLAHLTDAGVYGNNGGAITLENDLPSAAISGHLATVGSAGGVVTLAAAGLSIDETDNRVQIGYDGNGGGDIDILLTGDLAIDKQGTDDTFIGNGAFDSDVTGAATGNISINAGGTLTLTDANPGSGHLWIGNQGAPTFGETGNVTLIAGTIAEGTDLGPMIVADLGGGDVTLGVSNGDLAIDGASYDSSHNLTLLASGDLELPQTLSNDGTGSITLVAGWDGHSLSTALTQSGAYGNGNGVTTIGGEDASGDVFVGSAGGTTTVLTGELDVFAENGSAQLGYRGAGSGDITVQATGNVELLGGDPSSGTMAAMIGNGSVADEIDAPVGGNITVDAGATFFIETAGGTLPTGNTGGSGGFGGGGGLPGGGGVDCGSDCVLELPPGGGGGGGAPLQQDGGTTTLFVGNSAGRGTGTVSGSVTLTALDFNDESDSNGGFSQIIANDIVNGDVTIGQRDSAGFVELDHDFSYDSSHNLTILSGDGLGVDAVIQNDGSGNITLVAGWDGTTAPSDINAGTTSAFGFNGTNGSVIYVGDGCVESCTYDAEIGTKSGTLSVFGGSLNVDASEGYAQLGYHGAGTGDIVVGTIGGITLQGGNSDDPEWDAQIGNGSVARDIGGNVSGNITVTSGGAVDIEDGDGGVGWIGNAASGDFQETGNVTLIASSFTGDTSFIGSDLGDNSGNGGDVFVGVTGADGWSIDQDITYNSPHTLTLASVGNLQFDNTVQNDGTGNLNLVAGWDGTFTDMAQIVSSADYGANGATIFIGGSSQNENVSVGAALGTTTVLTGNLTIVPEGDLYGQLGYHGDGGGDITVLALGNITLEAGGSGSQYAQIGNGSIEEGQVSGPANGNIDVEAKGTLNLISDDQVGMDWIGNASDNSGSGAVTIVAADLGQTDRLAQMLRTDVQGGGTTLGVTDANSGVTFSDGITYSSAFTLSILTAGNLTIAGSIQNSSSGQLNIVAGWDGTTFDATQFDVAGVYGNNSGIINIGGSGAAGAVSVGSKGGTLVAGGDIHVNAAAFDAQIGYGDQAQGNIEVDATRDITVETLVGSGGGLTARIGNGTAGASGVFDGTITIDAQDLSMIAGDSGDMVQIGNGGANATGAYAGDITVTLSGQLEMAAEGPNQIVQLGNGSASGSGAASGAIAINVGSLLMRGDTGAAGSFVQIGNGGSAYAGAASGDIAVNVTGGLTIEELAGEPVWIGNLSVNADGAPAYSGDATISAGSASGLASTVSDVLAGGNLEIEISGDLDWNQDLTIDSSKTLSLLAAGNIIFDASLKNSGSGTLNIVAGWDGTTTDPSEFADSGVYGNGGGSVTIGGQTAGGDVSVGSATGIVNLFTDNLTVEADNGHAELGFDDEISGLSGGINVTAVDSVTLTGSDDDGVFAQIGNGVDLGDNSSGGGVGIIAGSMSQSGMAGIVGGTVSLATNNGAIGDSEGAISVTSTSLSVSTAGDDAFIASPNTGVSLSSVEMNGGNFTLVAGGPVTQTGSISADTLDIDTTATSDGNVTLDDTGNSFNSLSLNSGGSADITDSQDLSINAATVADNASLTLSSGGGITQSGAITADRFDVSTTGGTIVLDNGDNAIGTLSVGTAGADDATVFSDESIALETVNVGGTLTLNTTGAVTQSAELGISAGTLDVTAGESGITLDNDSNFVIGDVSLNSGGDAVFHDSTDISAGTSSVTGTLTLVSAFGITQDGAIGAGTLSVTANGGAITLDDTGNAFGTLNVTTTADFDATFADTGDLDISGANVGGLLTLSTTGAIAQDQAISAGSLSATAGAGGITLNTDGNSVAGEVSLNSGGDAIFQDGDGILMGASDVTGTLTLVSANGITQDGAIGAGTLSLDASGGVTLNDAGNSFGALDVSTSDTGTVSITDSTGVVLDDIQTGGDFTLNAAGDVTQNDALVITGALSVTTTNGGAVTLDNAENSVLGDVAFDGAADVTFDSAGAVDLDASSAVGTLTISAGGPITQSGDIGADALDVTTTSGGITLDDTDNSFNTLTVSSAAGAVVTDSQDLSVTSATVAEGATLTLTSAGGISQTGDITADNLAVTSGTGDIVLDDGNNAIGGLSVTTTGGHDATVFSNETIDLQTVSVDGTLTLNTTGGVTQEQGLDAGALNVTAGESGITLDNDDNDVTGDVSLNSGGDAVFHNDTDIAMGASNVTGTLTLVSAAGITQDGSIGAATLSATANNGAITLNDPGNAFGALAVSTTDAFDASFTDTGALDISASTVGGTLTVTTDGEITQSGAITAAGLTATSQDSDLGFGFNNFISGDVSLNAATDATFFNEGQLTVGTSNVGGLLSLTSSSAGITQDGAISADTLSLTAPGGVTLDNGGNSFNALDLFVSGTNANVVSDASSLELDDVSVGGDLVLSSGGDIAQTQPISVGGALTANADNGTITLDETGNDIGGTVSLNASGDATFDNGTDTDLGTSIVGGTLTVASDGAITQSGALTADTLDVSTTSGAITLGNTNNDFDTLHVATTREGDDATIVDGADLTVSGADVGGTLSLTANSIGQSGAISAAGLNLAADFGITLDDGNNSFQTLDVSGGNASVTDSTGVSLGTIDVAGSTFTLSAGGAVTQTGAIAASEVDVSTGTGAITLDNASNVFGSLNVTTVGGDVTIVDSQALTIDGADLGGDTAETGGTLTVTANAISEGATHIIAAAVDATATDGTVELPNAKNDVGSFSVTTSGDNEASLVNSGTLNISSASVGGEMFLDSTNGGITQSGAISAGGLIVGAATASPNPGDNDIVLDDPENAVSGRFEANTPNNASFTNSQSIVMDESYVDGTLTLVSGGGITQLGSGYLTVGTLTATAGEGSGIALNEDRNAIGTLNLTTTGGDASITDSTGVVLGAIGVDGVFTLAAGGDVTQSQALNLSHGFDISTSSGDITLNSDNDVVGTVSFGGAGNVTYVNDQSVDLGASIVVGTLSISAGDDITQEAGLQADALDVSAGGTITLDSAKNTFNTLSVSTAGEGAGDATLVDASDLTVTSATVEGSLTLTAASIGQSGAINAGALDVTSTDGGITLQDGGNAFASLNVTTGGSDAAVNDSQGFDLTGANLGSGTFTLSADGAITQSGAIAAGEVDVSTTTGSITLDNAENAFGALNVSTQGADGATIVDTGDLTVTGATIGGTLFLTADSIGQTGEIDANALGVTGANGITLDDTDNKFSGLEVSTTDADALIADAWGIDIYAANTGTGVLTINSGGMVSQEAGADITAGGLNVTADPRGIALSENNDVSGDVTFDTDGDVAFRNAGQVTFGNTDVGGTLTVVSGAGIDQDGAISAGTLTATAGEGTITLTDGGNAFGTLNLDTMSSSDVSIVDSTGVVLDSIAVGGRFILSAGGDVSQTEGLVLSNGMAISSSGGDITLNNPGNQVSGDVSFSTDGEASFSNIGQITLGQTTVGGTLTLTGAGIDQDGAVSAGTLTADATKGTVTLTDSGNVFGMVNLTTSSEEDVSVTDSTGVMLGAIAVGGKLIVAAGGDVTQNKALGLSNGMSITATGGDVTLDNADNRVSGDVAFNGTGDASFVNGVATTLDTSSVDGTLTVTAGGDITQDGAITAGELDVATTSGSITLTNEDNDFAALNAATTGEDGATIVDGTDLTVTGANVGGTLSLTANSIGQTGAITADTLSVSDGTGIVLTNEDNAFDNLQVSTDGADASFADSRDMNVISANLNGGTLTLDSSGAVTQSGAIAAGGLTVSAGESGGITLDDARNAVSGDVSLTVYGVASFNNTLQTTLSNTSVSALTITSDAGIGEDGPIQVGTLTATAGGGTITLDDAQNGIGTVNLATTSSQDVAIVSRGYLSLGEITIGGKLVVAAANVDQQNALTLSHGMDITSTLGNVDLSVTGNAVSGPVTLHSAGDVTFYNTLTTQMGASRAEGNITLLSKGDIDVLDVVQSATGNVVVVAGWDGETTDPESFGNAGVYGNANGSLIIGGASATARALLGAQSGTTNVYAYNVSVLGTNADAQLGWHGAGGGDIAVTALNDLTVTAGAGNALIGNGSLGTDVEGNVTGDIDLTIGGAATFTNSTDKASWFGNRTDGTETGNVILVADSIDSEGGADIGTIVVTDVVGGDITVGGTSTEDGGIDVGQNYSYDSTHTLSLLTAGNLLVEGSIQNSGTGAINLVAGWDGQTLEGFGLGSAGLGGKGVTIGGADATGGVAIGSAGGTTSVYGASLTLSALNGYAQLGFHGAGTGAAVVSVSGNVALNGGAAAGDFAQIGNGGLGISGDNGGDILITAGGDVTLTGGAGSEAYAQIGLGGAESNSNSAGYSNTGDIAIAATNVVVDAGTGTGAYAQIGNGGLKSGQGLTGEGDNIGDIAVVASHSVSLLGDGDDAYAQIGNGGSQSNLNPAAKATGTDSGTIAVVAPNGADGSVTLGAGAGTNAYAQIGNGGYAVNAGANAVANHFTIGGDIVVTDLVLTGNGNNGYAVIGNGDVTQNSYGDVSGDIVIDANGNITYTNGAGTKSFATIGNFTGHGTVSGTIHGATPPDIDGGGGDGGDGGVGDINNSSATVGVVNTLQTDPKGGFPITVINTIVVTIEQPDSTTNGLTATLVDDNPPGPLASLDSGSADSEPPTTADSATVVIADSLDGDKQGSTTQSMLGGLLKQNNTPTGSHAVHAIPPADQDFSSWGNEALWQ